MRWREQTKLLDKETCRRLLDEIMVKVPERVRVIGKEEYNLGGELKTTATGEADLERLEAAENVIVVNAVTSDESNSSDNYKDVNIKTSTDSEIGRDREYTSELYLKLDRELQPEKVTSTCDTVVNNHNFIVTDKMFKTSDVNTAPELQPEKVTSFCDTVDYNDSIVTHKETDKIIVTHKETDKIIVENAKGDKKEVTVKIDKNFTVTDRSVEKYSIGRDTNEQVKLKPRMICEPPIRTVAGEKSKTPEISVKRNVNKSLSLIAENTL